MPNRSRLFGDVSSCVTHEAFGTTFVGYHPCRYRLASIDSIHVYIGIATLEGESFRLLEVQSSRKVGCKLSLQRSFPAGSFLTTNSKHARLGFTDCWMSNLCVAYTNKSQLVFGRCSHQATYGRFRSRQGAVPTQTQDQSHTKGWLCP